MRHHRLLACLLLAAAFLIGPPMARTFSGGAPPQRTGAPGEQTCATAGCHNSFALNSGPGALSIEAPETYTPGQPVEIVVRMEQDGAPRYGFEITVADAAGLHPGTFELVDTNTRFASGAQNYVTHAQADGTNTWTVRWTAPAEGVGDLTIYASGNAADGSGSPSGDHVYTAQQALDEGSGVATEREAAPEAFVLRRPFPNPFRAQATVPFELRQPAPVTLRLYDAAGRVVRVQELGHRAGGAHEVLVSAEGLAAGLYHVEVSTPAGRRSLPLVRVR